MKWIAIAVVVAIAIAIVIATVGGGSDSKSSTPLDSITPKYGRASAPASLVQSVASVPSTVYDEVGLGTGKLPQKIDDVALGTATKPDFLFVGAEYCPFCAAERWAMVNALSRFGTFHNLQVTHSSATDTPANIETFSFHGSTYTSSYLTFTPVELETNKPSDNGYGLLDNPTQKQADLWQKYTGQAFPFLYFNGRYATTSAFDPGLLGGKTHTQIAAALHDPKSKIARAAIGTANAVTAAICSLTNNKPASACTVPAITTLEAQLRQ